MHHYELNFFKVAFSRSLKSHDFARALLFDLIGLAIFASTLIGDW